MPTKDFIEWPYVVLLVGVVLMVAGALVRHAGCQPTSRFLFPGNLAPHLEQWTLAIKLLLQDQT